MATWPASIMTSPNQEALTARSKSHLVQYSPDYIGRKVGSINRATHCWVAQSSIREKFDSEIEPEMDRCLKGWNGSVARLDSFNITIYMVGMSKRTASPTIVFMCEDASFRKEAKQVIKESGILKKFPGFRIVYVPKDPFFGTGGPLEPLASGQDAEQSDGHIDGPVTEVFYDREKTPTDVGMPIYIKHGSSMRAATASVIHLEGRTFYVAPSHAFFSRQQALESPTAKTDDDFEFDSDSEFAYDDELAMITSIGSQSPDVWSDDDHTPVFRSASLSSNNSYSTPTFDVTNRQDMANTSNEIETVINKLLPLSKVEVKYPPRSITIPSSDCLAPLGMLVDWSVDQDWALVEVKNEALQMLLLNSKSLVDLSNVPLAPLPEEDKKVVAYTASGGQMTGTVATTTSYTRVPRGQSFQKVFSVKLDGPLANGDCGSTVFDAVTGELFGHIVAGCRDTGFAQVMAGHNVIPQIQSSARKLLSMVEKSLEPDQATDVTSRFNFCSDEQDHIEDIHGNQDEQLLKMETRASSNGLTCPQELKCHFSARHSMRSFPRALDTEDWYPYPGPLTDNMSDCLFAHSEGNSATSGPFFPAYDSEPLPEDVSGPTWDWFSPLNILLAAIQSAPAAPERYQWLESQEVHCHGIMDEQRFSTVHHSNAKDGDPRTRTLNPEASSFVPGSILDGQVDNCPPTEGFGSLRRVSEALEHGSREMRRRPKIIDSNYRRPRISRAFCKFCNDQPDGFRGDHELRRHINLKHSDAAIKFTIRDPATLGQASNSQSVQSPSKCPFRHGGKGCYSYYNAAAHLRRAHFKPKVPCHSNEERYTNRAGKDDHDLHDLKYWLDCLASRSLVPGAGMNQAGSSDHALNIDVAVLDSGLDPDATFAKDRPWKHTIQKANSEYLYNLMDSYLLHHRSNIDRRGFSIRVRDEHGPSNKSVEITTCLNDKEARQTKPVQKWVGFENGRLIYIEHSIAGRTLFFKKICTMDYSAEAVLNSAEQSIMELFLKLMARYTRQNDVPVIWKQAGSQRAIETISNQRARDVHHDADTVPRPVSYEADEYDEILGAKNDSL